jgi:hypothetical protein
MIVSPIVPLEASQDGMRVPHEEHDARSITFIHSRRAHETPCSLCSYVV